MVNYDPYELVTLTGRGRRAAESVDRRHHVLREFLQTVLGLDAGAAEVNACRMEHSMDDETIERLGHMAEFIETRPQWRGDQWLEQFTAFYSGEPSARDEDSRANGSRRAGRGQR